MANKRHAPAIEINPRLQDRFTGTTVICPYCHTKQFITDDDDPPACSRCHKQTQYMHTWLQLEKLVPFEAVAVGFAVLKEQLRLLINKANKAGNPQTVMLLMGRYFMLCCLQNGGPFVHDVTNSYSDIRTTCGPCLNGLHEKCNRVRETCTCGVCNFQQQEKM